MDLTHAKWRKSTYTGPNGGNCIELAALPPNWRKSSRSGSNGGDCVELAAFPGTVAVRDSKDPQGPVLLLRPGALREAVQAASDER